MSKPFAHNSQLRDLADFIAKIPCINSKVGKGVYGDELWWLKFSIDTKANLAWRVIQELAHILNYISIENRLPTIFYPVSPPPYLNGGTEFLSWVIEAKQKGVDPAYVHTVLENRLPSLSNDASAWDVDP